MPLKRGWIKKHKSTISFDYGLFLIRFFAEARAEIFAKISLFFWSIWRHQKDILKLTDLYWSTIYDKHLLISSGHWRAYKIRACFNDLTLIGMRGDTFISFSFLDQILSFYQNFPNLLKVKIDINQVILTPCPAYWVF